MCNCGRNGNHFCVSPCGSQCVTLGPFRATNTICPPRNTGSVIPFSSGTAALAFATTATGLVGTGGIIGFGTSVSAVPITTSATGNTLTLPTAAGTTEAFSVPRAGSITAISASYTPTTAVTVPAGATAVIRAQVYRAPAGSNVFTATGAYVDLTPALTGTVAVGTTLQGTADVSSVPVAPGDRLVMVFTVSGTGITAPLTVTGAATAGITIS